MEDNRQLELWEKLNENSTVKEIQEYIENTAQIRGFHDQAIEKRMLILIEEVGELAKAIRKDATNIGVDNSKIEHYNSIESEIADVFIVLNSICNKLNIDLLSALKEKEKENIKRVWKN